jgi:ubiquinone/menaquinone biosynthesis C-methylase UbiE
MEAKNWTLTVEKIIQNSPAVLTPSYYKNCFHAYSNGNLCMQAAVEQEIAGVAVNIRHFPTDKWEGKNDMRDAIDRQIAQLGGKLLPSLASNEERIIVDFGCGTGISTRRLASLFPEANKIIGIDLSPHMIAVANYLQQQGPSFEWIEPVREDSRISFQFGDIAKTPLPNESVSLVNLCFILHELPYFAALDVIREASRILKKGGVLAISEIDPSSAPYKRAMGNPLLFSIFKSTEPYLDEYFFKTYPQLNPILENNGFPCTLQSASTSRFLTTIARKSGTIDLRPNDIDRMASDTHLKPLEYSRKETI